MIRQFFRDSFLYGISSIVVQGSPILVLPIYVRLLSPTEYGVLEVLTIFALFVNSSVSFEILQGFARHYPDSRTERDRKEYSSTTFWFTLAAYGLFVGITLPFSEIFSQIILHAPIWEKTFQVAVIATSLHGIYLLLLNQLRWQLKPFAYASVSAVNIILAVSTGIFLIVEYQTGLVGIFYGQTVGCTIAGVLAWLWGSHSYRLIFDWPKCKEMLRFSVPLIPSSLAVIATVYVDRIAIQNIMTLVDVGVYTVGFRVASIANLMMAGVYFALTPLIYQNYVKDSMPDDVERILMYVLCGTLPLLVGISLFAKEIVFLFATEPYYGAWFVVPILAVAAVCSKLYIFFPGLDIAKKTKTIAFINIAAAFLNIILNILLIPLWGIIGAALATLIGAAVLLAGYVFMSQKFYPIPYRAETIFLACSTAAFIIVVGYLVSSTEYFSGLVLTLLKLCALILGSAWIIRQLAGTRNLGRII
ncbi:MAG: oligosaccharide flippase family protein [Pseudomonadota bacterium]|nr:oligosaccharide flippase family protein [Pseudomonadota bacterium]